MVWLWGLCRGPNRESKGGAQKGSPQKEPKWRAQALSTSVWLLETYFYWKDHHHFKFGKSKMWTYTLNAPFFTPICCMQASSLFLSFHFRPTAICCKCMNCKRKCSHNVCCCYHCNMHCKFFHGKFYRFWLCNKSHYSPVIRLTMKGI